ncbi:MAG: hypothetical protein V4739_06145 [Pseudomonadota bacterium]
MNVAVLQKLDPGGARFGGADSGWRLSALPLKLMLISPLNQVRQRNDNCLGEERYGVAGFQQAEFKDGVLVAVVTFIIKT